MQAQVSTPTTIVPARAHGLSRVSSYILALIAGVMFILAINALFQTLSMPWVGILIDRSTSQVFEVQRASSNIGAVQVGDQVLSIDGDPPSQARPIYGNAAVGESVPLVVRRGNEILEINLLVEDPSQEIYLTRTIHQFTSLVFWLLGIAIFIRHPRQLRSQVFLLMCLCVTATLSFLDLLRYQVPTAPREIYNTGLWLFGATFVHIHTLFPVPRLKRRWHVVNGLFYLVALYIIASYITSNVDAVPRLTVTIANIYLVASLIIGVLLLLNAWRTGDGRVHRQLRTLVFGTLLASLPVITFVIISNYVPVPSSDIALVGLVAFPATYAYVLRGEDLITTDHILYRVLLYVLLSLALVIGYLLILQAVGYLNPLWHASPLTGSIISLIIAFTFSPTREVIDRALNRIFYGVGYNYLQVLNPAVRKISNLQQGSIVEVLTSDIPSVLGVSNAGVWLATQQGYTLLGGNLTEQDLDSVLATEQWKHHVLKQSDEPLLLKQENLLSDEFTSSESHVFVPVRWAVPLNLSNEMQGVWLLGPRVKDESFSPIDQRLIALTARTVALVLKVSSLLHELQVQLDINSADHTEMLNAYRQLTRVREDERQYLARELHDGVLQTSITLRLACERLTTLQPEAQSLVSQIQAQLQEMVVNVRSICQGLRPPALATNGLHSGLKSLVTEMYDKHGLQAVLDITLPYELPSDWQLNLYRMVQESLINVAKHARTSSAWVHISTSGKLLELRIEDEGAGFNPGDVIGHRFGLVGLRERARALGGDLTVISTPGNGTTISATIALPEAELGNQ